MIDEIYNSRIGAIKTDHFSDEWEQTAIPFEESLTEEQIIMFHKLCDLQSETAAAEMRAAYKAGFKDGVTLMRFLIFFVLIFVEQVAKSGKVYN